MAINILSILFLVFSNVSGCKTEQSLTKLIVKNPNVTKIVDSVYNEAKDDYSWKKEFFLLRVSQIKDSCEFRISIFNCNELRWYLSDRKDSLLGFFERDGRTVFVFGKFNENYFSKSNEVKKFTCFPDSSNRMKKGVLCFESMVWYYEDFNGEMIFRKKGIYPPLE